MHNWDLSDLGGVMEEGSVDIGSTEGFSVSGRKYSVNQNEQWIQYDCSNEAPSRIKKAPSRIKLQLPVEINATNYGWCLDAIENTIEEMNLASPEKVWGFNIAKHPLKDSQVGKNVSIFLGEELADDSQALSEFCTRLSENLKVNDVEFMNVPNGSNLRTTSVAIEGANDTIFITNDGRSPDGHGYLKPDSAERKQLVKEDKSLQKVKVIDGLNKDSREIISRNIDEYKRIYNKINGSTKIPSKSGNISYIQVRIGNEEEVKNAVNALRKIGCDAWSTSESGCLLLEKGKAYESFKIGMEADAFPAKQSFEEIERAVHLIDTKSSPLEKSTYIDLEGLPEKDVTAIRNYLRENNCILKEEVPGIKQKHLVIGKDQESMLKLLKDTRKTSQIWHGNISNQDALNVLNNLREGNKVEELSRYIKEKKIEDTYAFRVDTKDMSLQAKDKFINQMYQQGYVVRRTDVDHLIDVEMSIEQGKELDQRLARKNATYVKQVGQHKVWYGDDSLDVVDRLMKEGRVERADLFDHMGKKVEDAYGLRIDTSNMSKENVNKLINEANKRGFQARLSESKEGWVTVIKGKELENAVAETRDLEFAVKVKGDSSILEGHQIDVRALDSTDREKLGQLFEKRGCVVQNMNDSKWFVQNKTSGSFENLLKESDEVLNYFSLGNVDDDALHVLKDLNGRQAITSEIVNVDIKNLSEEDIAALEKRMPEGKYSADKGGSHWNIDKKDWKKMWGKNASFFNGEIPPYVVAGAEAELANAETITGLSKLTTPPAAPLSKKVSATRKLVNVLNTNVSELEMTKAASRTIHVATEALANTSVGRTVANLGNTVSQTARNVTRAVASTKVATKVGQMAVKVVDSPALRAAGKFAGPLAFVAAAGDHRIMAAATNMDLTKVVKIAAEDVKDAAKGVYNLATSSEAREKLADAASDMVENPGQAAEAVWDAVKDTAIGSGMSIAMTIGAGDKKMRQGNVEIPVLDANGNPVIEDGQVKTEDAYYMAVQENPHEYSIAQRVGSKMIPVGIYETDEKGKVISSTINHDNSETGIYSHEVTYYDDKPVTSLKKEFGVDESDFDGSIVNKWAKDFGNWGGKLFGGDGKEGNKLFGVNDSTMGMPKKKVSSIVYTKPDPNQTVMDIRQHTDGQTEVVVRRLVRTEKTEYPNYYRDGVKNSVDVVAKNLYEERVYPLSEQEAERLASCKDNAEQQKMIAQITAEIDEIREEEPNKRICQVSSMEKNQYYREVYDRNSALAGVVVPGGVNINEHDAVLARVENYSDSKVFYRKGEQTVNTSLAGADITVGEFTQLDRDDKGKFVQNKLSFKNHKINGEKTVSADEEYDYLNEKAVFIHEKDENGEMKVAQMVRVNSNTGVIKRFDADGNMVDVCVPGSEEHDAIALMIDKDVKVPEFDGDKAKVRLAERKKEREENAGLSAAENTETANETEVTQEKTNGDKENTSLAAAENTETPNKTESVNAPKVPPKTSILAQNSTQCDEAKIEIESSTLTYATAAGIFQHTA